MFEGAFSMSRRVWVLQATDWYDAFEGLYVVSAAH